MPSNLPHASTGVAERVGELPKELGRPQPAPYVESHKGAVRISARPGSTKREQTKSAFLRGRTQDDTLA
jgi:hypothetical protein